jgi:hypothetical protein
MPRVVKRRPSRPSSSVGTVRSMPSSRAAALMPDLLAGTAAVRPFGINRRNLHRLKLSPLIRQPDPFRNVRHLASRLFRGARFDNIRRRKHGSPIRLSPPR